MDEIQRQRLIVAITGATGAIFGIRILERLRDLPVESHLVISSWGGRTIEHETDFTVAQVRALADVVHKASDQSSTLSSGSFLTGGMVIAPCSVKTLAAIANGLASDLVSRAADVVLKEQRPLVLMVREAPLNAIHLDNMTKLARLGVTIDPPMPAFYNHPRSLDDLIDHIVTRTLDQLRLHTDATPRWDGKLDEPTNRQDL